MIRTPTVFVVGAGASCELGFPSGSKLLKELETALNIRFRADGEHTGDSRILDAFRDIVRTNGGGRVELNAHLDACSRICDAAHLGISIDNVISQIDQDPLVPICGKIGIARQILRGETESSIRINANNPARFPLSSVRETWLGRFVQLLSQDMRSSSLETIFDNVSVVSFNYDRSIRRTLPYALASQFALSEATAQDLSNRLKIYHPYGSLGPLPYETSPPKGISYGEADVLSLAKVATNLRTFTEQQEDIADLADMRDSLSGADRIVFLGFGYHRQNMELLTTNVLPTASRIYGTSLGLSASDTEVVSDQLNFFYREQYRGFHAPVLLPLKCAEFIDYHFRTLVSPRIS